MNYILMIIAFIFSVSMGKSANAQDCVAAPNCYDLGYIQSCSTCENVNIKLACPFDNSMCLCASTIHLSCDDLGYKDDINSCPGDYSICPHDAAKVKCMFEAQVGDLKYSWKTSNHNGWLLCDGASISKSQFPQLVELLGGNKLPDYRGYFLKGFDPKNNDDIEISNPAGLPNITGSVTLVGLEDSDNGLFTETGLRNKYDHGETGGEGRLMTVTFDASKSSEDSIYGNSDTVTPQNYPANIFVYAGNKEKSNNEAEPCDVGYFVYADGTCSSDFSSNKIAIGVIYEKSNTGNKFSYGYFYGGPKGEYGKTTCTDNAGTEYRGSVISEASPLLEKLRGLSGSAYKKLNLSKDYHYWCYQRSCKLLSNGMNDCTTTYGQCYLSNPGHSMSISTSGSAYSLCNETLDLNLSVW